MNPTNKTNQLLILLIFSILFIQSCKDEMECGCEFGLNTLETTGEASVYLNTEDNNFYLDESDYQLLICNSDLLPNLNLDIHSGISYTGYINQPCENNEEVKVITLTSSAPTAGCDSPPIWKFENIQGKLYKNGRSPYVSHGYYISAYTANQQDEWILFICNDSMIQEIDIPEYPESIDVEFTGDLKRIEGEYYEFGGYEHALITLDEIEEE